MGEVLLRPGASGSENPVYTTTAVLKLLPLIAHNQ